MTAPVGARRGRVLVGVAIAILIGLALAAWGLATNRAPQQVDLATLDVVTLEGDPGVRLPHPVMVPEADQGCPAFTVDAPVPTRDAVSGQDTWFSLDAGRGSSLVLTCLGPVAETGRIGEVIGAVPLEAEGSIRFGTPVWVRSAFGEALRTETHFDSTGTTLTEWFTERDGHLVAVGHLHRTADVADFATIEAMLTTWRWS